MIWSLESICRLRVTPSHHQAAEMALRIQRHLEAPHHIHHLVSSKETNTGLAWDSVLFGNTGDLHWKWQNNTTTTSCMAGANSGRHGLRWQILSDRSCNDWPRQGYPVPWAMIIRRRTELGWGVTPCLCCQEASVGLANRPNSVPNQ